jgi:peptidoglycan/LPS O-acetylase OafA/YrhL
MSEERLVGLDLLRGLAALSVAIPHFLLIDQASPDLEATSVVAVEIFFVLSGFVLGPQVLRCAIEGTSALRVFLIRRWIQTVPPYLLALLLVSFLAGTLFTPDFWRYAFYVENLFRQHTAIDYYPVAWSLSIEEWFYVSLPLLLVALKVRPDRIVFVAIGYIAVVTAARLIFGDTADWGPDIRRVVIFRVDSIAYGFLLWLALSRWSAKIQARYAGPAFVIGTVIAFACAFLARSSAVLAQAFPFAAAACGASAIMLFRSCEPLLTRNPLSAISGFLGRISYSLYLFHLPIGIGVHQALVTQPLSLQTAIYILACATFCAIFYYAFEKPILAARPRYRGSRDAQPLLQAGCATNIRRHEVF